jgi:hypothetical protein
VASPSGLSQARASNCKHIRLASLPDPSAFPRVRNNNSSECEVKYLKSQPFSVVYEGLFKARAIIYVDPPFPLLLTFLVEPYTSKVTKRLDGDRSCGSLSITQADQIAYTMGGPRTWRRMSSSSLHYQNAIFGSQTWLWV